MKFRWPKTVPESQINREFIQGMLDRMAQGYFKYGHMRSEHERRVDAYGSAKIRLEQYEKTGNLENLMDAANYLMMEFTMPPEGRFYQPDAEGSPGFVTQDGRRHAGRLLTIPERLQFYYARIQGD